MKNSREIVKTTGMILGLFVLFAGSVLVPYGIRDSRLRNRIDDARTKLGINDVDHSGLVRLNEEVVALRTQLGSKGRYVPDENQVSQVLQELSKLINAPGVSDQEILTTASQYYADYNILPVKIQFSAPFATAYDLVRQIEHLSNIVRVDRFDIEAEPEYPRQPLTVTLELSAFFSSQSDGGVQ